MGPHGWGLGLMPTTRRNPRPPSNGVQEWQRHTTRLVVRCSPELAERARRAAEGRQVTLAEVLEVGVNRLEDATMGFSTARDVAAAVAERLGLERTRALEDAVRAAVPGRYEDVSLDDALLRDVWARVEPRATYPF